MKFLIFIISIPFMIYLIKALKDGKLTMGSFGYASINDGLLHKN